MIDHIVSWVVMSRGQRVAIGSLMEMTQYPAEQKVIYALTRLGNLIPWANIKESVASGWTVEHKEFAR